MWHKGIIFLLTIVAACSAASGQKVALSNNLILDGTASINMGVELKVGGRTTINVPGSFNLWDFNEEKKFKHFAVQPEFRIWTCQPFSGHFWGIHAHYSLYNVGGIGPFTILKNSRYEGWLAGGGITYGYSWILSPRWSLEATAGVGYAYMSYDKFPCGRCQPASHRGKKHYFGPTKIGLSLVFMIK